MPGLALLCAVQLAGGSPALRAQLPPDYERPPIAYSRTAPQDAVAQLRDRLARGEIALRGSDEEILRAVLRALRIPPDSQLLVFSRTSLQAGLIRPAHPRAIYFSDSAYVGWVPGGLIEVAAIDPALGPVFYGFDPQDARDGRRTFVRETSCLRCHGGSVVRDIPGLFAGSPFTAADGEPLSPRGREIMDDTTPFARRFGGWYVTGYTGTAPHRGNAFAREAGGRIEFTPSDQRPADLAATLDTSPYLTASSDIVASLVFAHQLALHNSLTRAAQRTRLILEHQQARQRAAHEPVTPEPVDESALNVVATAAEDVLDHLLFRDAAPLPDGVRGGDAFRHAFAADARRSSAGDALKDLSLHGRLFANRCSFLIYSDSLAALPAPLKNRILDRLAAVLRDADPSGRYAYLEADEKRRILAVLGETYPDAGRHFAIRPE
jgi:hypothetical protein